MSSDDSAVLDAQIGDNDLNLRYADVVRRPETAMYWQETRLVTRSVALNTSGGGGKGGKGGSSADTSALARRLRAIMRTRCDVTAAALRDALDTHQRAKSRWVSCERVDAGVCQVVYGGGDHWITYVVESGHVYHSWMGKFLLRRDCVLPGAMTRAKALELAANLDFLADIAQPPDDDDDSDSDDDVDEHVVIYARCVGERIAAGAGDSGNEA